jgi:hypothetical protein
MTPAQAENIAIELSFGGFLIRFLPISHDNSAHTVDELVKSDLSH